MKRTIKVEFYQKHVGVEEQGCTTKVVGGLFKLERICNDTRALTQLNNALQNNGQTISDNAEEQKIADKTLKNASERAKEYGNQIVANTKTLSDFKKENEVEDPNKQVKPKFTDGLKSFASSALSSIGNAVVSAGTAMIAQH